MGTRDFSHWPRNSSTDNDRPISVNSCKIFLIVTGHLCGPLRANFDYDQKGQKKTSPISVVRVRNVCIAENRAFATHDPRILPENWNEYEFRILCRARS